MEKLGAALVQVGEEHRDASLATLEQAVLEAVRDLLPRLLEVVLRMSTTALQPSQADLSRTCPRCGTRARVQSWRGRRVHTVCGVIGFERPWYVCGSCGQGFSPVDRTLALAARQRLSTGVRQWLIGLGARTSFGEAAVLLEQLTGQEVSPETVRQQTEGYGEELEEEQQRQSEEVAKTQEAAAPLDPAPGILAVETDGVNVRYRDGGHEVKIGLVGGYEGGKMTAPSYIAARLSAEAFGPRLLAEAARRGALEVVDWEGPLTQRGLAVLRKVVVLGDGAHWIWNLAAEYFGERVEIVDFFHATEHIWAVARALFGEGTKAGQGWAEERVSELWNEGAEPVIKALAEAKGESAEAKEVLRVQRGYFRTNARRMDYPSFRAQGLPIGSGAVESSAKHLVQQRMKRPGARWSDLGAQGVLNVRSRLLSDLPIAC
jgi:hypothetical protein